MAKARHTTKRDINAAERGRLALELRKAGLTLDEIARQCGYSNRSGAFHAIKRELDRIPVESAKDLRTVEYLRLEQLTALVFPLVTGEAADEAEATDEEKPDKKRKVSLWAVDRLLALSERRAKLLGLDTPIESAQAGTIVVIREIPANYLNGPVEAPQS